MVRIVCLYLLRNLKIMNMVEEVKSKKNWLTAIISAVVAALTSLLSNL